MVRKIFPQTNNTRPLAIIKLGGSILTDKKGSHKFRLANTRRIAREIKSILLAQPQNLAIICGAGGQGHHLAKRFGLQNGASTPGQVLGAALTHIAVKKLQLAVAERLLAEGLPAIPLQTNNFFYADSAGKIHLKQKHVIQNCFNKSMIPIFYGDMVFHPEKNFTILSGDTIAIILAQLFLAEKIIFASDVNGVYPYPPSGLRSEQSHISQFSRRELTNFLKQYKKFTGTDASGELIGKLRAIQKKPKNCKTYIINGLKPDSIKRALLGMPGGTVII